MQKAKEDEKKLNLIKCPLPKIIYSTICGLPTFPKKSGITANTNTYYSKKNSNQRKGLPSLKTNNKFTSSPNKTNYTNAKISNHLNNTSNNMTNMNKTNNIKMNKVNNSINNNNNKEINSKTMKETLTNFGLNKYYDKMVDLGLNDQNYNSIGLMNKKSFNELISNIRMFPGHIIKMEQLYHYLKQINFSNKPLHIYSNPKINNNSINVNSSYDNSNSSNFNNNNVNYVTISFNRNNNNVLNGKIMHSKSHNKYRFINPMIRQKNLNDNFNSEISKSKSKVIQHQPITNYSNHRTTKNKNRSNNKVNNINKSNFEFPNPPMNPGRNLLIKYFFKDLANFTNNISGLGNKIASKNNMNNLFNSNNTNNGLLNNTKDLNQEIKPNMKSKTYNDKNISKNNLQENVQNDLPSINNISNNNNSRTLLNSIYRTLNKQASPQLESRREYIKKIRKNKNNKNKNKNNSNDIIDKSKTINSYQRAYSINTFLNDEYEKNANNNTGGVKAFGMNKKQNINLLNNNNKNFQQKTAYENMNKNNRLNNGIRLKLPNVMNKTDFQNSLEKPKLNKNGNEQNNNNAFDKKDNKNFDINANTNSNVNIKQYNSNIVLKNEKTVLKRANKNFVSTSKEKKINTPNSVGEKANENEINTVVIKSWDENVPFEEKKPIRLREKANPNVNNINNINNNIINDNKEDIENNNNIKEKNDNKIISENKNEIIINNNINENNNITNQKIELMKYEKQNIENADNDDYNLEDLIYENLRLNKTFSEDKDQNIFKFDIEYMCRCLSLSLLILIESSKENLHITEVILQDFSSPDLRFFFLNQNLNQNINVLFDMFDHEINKDLSFSKISPLDRLELILSGNEMGGNDDINALKHLKKEADEILIKEEEEKEKKRSKNGKGMVKIRTGLGDIEKDIKFIDEFFSMNSKNKKKVINYQYVSDITKNVLCKELSYINEIDSELNGTNSNINNTNFNNSNNNINDNSIRAKKVNTSNIIDNEEVKEENNTFNNETNDLGITTENNDDKIENKNMSNNSVNLDEDINNKNTDVNTINKKDFDIDLNEDNKIISPINDNDNFKKTNNENDNKINDKIDINLNDNTNNIQITINNKLIISKIEKKDADKAQKEEKEEKENKNQLQQKEPNNKEKSSLSLNTQNKEASKENNEEDIYESDYVIDIKTVDELVYYFVKRSEIFDEDFNYLIMKIAERRYIPPPDPQTIFDFMADIIILTKMEKEVIILSLIYIERLIFNTGILITSRNWRRILLTSMIISSKIWDDNSYQNTHYSQVFANLGVSEINSLERIFLELINYKVYVKQSEYFRYLLMIKSIALKYNFDGRQIIPVSVIKNLKYQEFTEALQNRMRKKVTLNNSAQF